MIEVKAIYINDALRQMDIARINNSLINLKAWDSEGNIIDYRGWLVQGGHWRGGFHRLRNPVSKEIRTVPDCFIIKFMDKQIIY